MKNQTIQAVSISAPLAIAAGGIVFSSMALAGRLEVAGELPTKIMFLSALASSLLAITFQLLFVSLRRSADRVWGAGVQLAGMYRNLEKERSHDQAQATYYRDRTQRYETEIEQLTLMREIHRASNIREKFERLSRMVCAIGEMASVREITIFLRNLGGEGPVPCVHFRSGRRGGALGALGAGGAEQDGRQERLFLHFTAPLSGRSLRPGGVKEERRAGSIVVHAALVDGDSEVGQVEATFPLGASGLRRRRSERPGEALLTAALGEIAIDESGVAETFEHPNLHHLHDQKTNTCQLVWPLVAEQTITGVLKVAVALDGASEQELRMQEELLGEAARHLGLAIKKEEDQERALRDGLTGLYIKRHMLEFIAGVLAERREGEKHSLIMMDIDHFKRINDTYGHPAGDEVLKGVARIISLEIRSCDRAFRYGGEEIGVLLAETDGKGALVFAERLRRIVAAAVFRSCAGKAISVTISLGVAQAVASVRTAEELVERADKVLYKAKESGRNCSRLYGDRASSRRVSAARGRALL